LIAPRFSIVIPCFNQGAFLAECLASVRAQTLAPHEVIVVDDGSTDPWSAQRIRELCTPPVILVAQENRGLAGARNTGVRRATGDWILPLDADDQLAPDALATYAEAIARAPEVDVWYPDIEHFGLENGVWVAPAFNAWRLLWSNLMICSSAIHRRVFDAGVLYNEKMRAGYEDWEFYVHACCDAGFLARGLEKPVFRYRRMGYSMLASANALRERLVDQLQRERSIYAAPEKLLDLKRRESPFFAVAANGSALERALASQGFRDWRLADVNGRVSRDGDLSVFNAKLGRSLLVSMDDAALARCLEADPFLLEKIAAKIVGEEPSVIWLVTTADEGEAYPGFPAHELDDRASCVAFAISTRFTFTPPGIVGGGPSLAADVARHFEAVAPGTQLSLLAGARGAAQEGIAVPPEARRSVVTATAPVPNWKISARERALFLREAATRIVKATIGRKRFERMERTRAYTVVRALARGQPIPAAGEPLSAEPPPPTLPPGHRAGPLEIERMRSRGYKETAWAISEEPPLPASDEAREGPGFLVAVPWIIHGGADRATLDLLHGLSRVAPGLRKYLLVTQPARMSWAPEVLRHVDGAFALPGPADKASDRIASLVQRLRVDSLLVVSSQAAFDALPAIRQLPRRVRVAAQFHGFDRDRATGALAGWPVYATSRYNNLIDEYAVISRFVADRLTDQQYVSPTKIRVVHLGIDSARFAAARRERLGGAPARVLWIGRLAHEKDPLMAVRVAAAWKAKHGPDQLRLTIAGGGPLEDEVRALVRSLRVEDMVELAGPVDDPVPLYRAADAVFLTSRYEGIPVVVYEAMAAGLPVVTVHEKTSIAEVLPRERAWFVDRRDDPAAYVEQLEALLEDPGRARAITERNAAESARFDVTRYAREMVEVLFPGLTLDGEDAAAGG
jgi:glycosyltransferase involved in cell wall biosynthesis